MQRENLSHNNVIEKNQVYINNNSKKSQLISQTQIGMSKGSTSATLTIPIQKTGPISLKERSSSAIALKGEMQIMNK
jgi:hypothetical protein